MRDGLTNEIMDLEELSEWTKEQEERYYELKDEMFQTCQWEE